MVRLGRFELPTSCFGGTRSIHLSYSRAVPLYHAVLLLCIGGRDSVLTPFHDELAGWRAAYALQIEQGRARIRPEHRL
jgi:hypothetical protein